MKTSAEAIEFIRSVRSEHSDARHNVYAYLIASENATRYSDDGEPQGTAGIPLLSVLRSSGVSDAVVTVTRYFGGYCSAHRDFCAPIQRLPPRRCMMRG